MPPDTCPAEPDLVDFHLGRLPAETLARLEGHLAGCARCEAYLHRLDGMSDTVLGALRPPLRVGLALPGERYAFNTAGQVIELEGLLCLLDAEGPCANAVKDAQRTKTGPMTRETLSLVWGTTALPGRASRAETWYRELLTEHGATTEPMK